MVTKGKLAVYLARALHLKATVKTKFRDVPKSQATGVKKVVAAGIMKGCATTRFCPNTAITRGRMAAYLVKALHLTATGKGQFKDVSKRHKFATAINRLATAGLAITCAKGQFCPDRKITRAETAAFLAKVMARTDRHAAAADRRATPAVAPRSRPKRGWSTRRSPTTWSAPAPRRAAPARRSWPPSPRAGSSPSTAARTR